MNVIVNCINGVITVYDKFVDGVEFSNYTKSTHEEVSSNPFIAISTVVGDNIVTDIKAAREMSHSIRRKNREDMLAPLDSEIAKQIPGTFDELEAKRQVIREDNAAIQVDIDNATSVEELKEILNRL